MVSRPYYSWVLWREGQWRLIRRKRTARVPFPMSFSSAIACKTWRIRSFINRGMRNAHRCRQRFSQLGRSALGPRQRPWVLVPLHSRMQCLGAAHQQCEWRAPTGPRPEHCMRRHRATYVSTPSTHPLALSDRFFQNLCGSRYT